MSNDYLALAGDSRIVEAQREELTRNGQGTLMSSIFLRDDNPQWRLEEEMAQFMGAEAALIFQSGYAANMGLIQSIATEETPVYIDQLAHRSLLEGIRAAGATPRTFRHNDVDYLSRLIKRHGPGVVLVDSVYSTNGSVCPLSDLVPLAYDAGCVVVVDESHSLGTHGPMGEGLVYELELIDKVHFRTASLAKAFCGRAGIVTCEKEFADYFRFEALPVIFSSALLPHELAGLHETLNIIKSEGWRRKRLERNAEWLRSALREIGLDIGDSDSQIIAIEGGDELTTIQLRDVLEDAGIFGSVFFPPATSLNRSLVRLSLHSLLGQQQLEAIRVACERIVYSGTPAIRAIRAPNAGVATGR